MVHGFSWVSHLTLDTGHLGPVSRLGLGKGMGKTVVLQVQVR